MIQQLILTAKNPERVLKVLYMNSPTYSLGIEGFNKPQRSVWNKTTLITVNSGIEVRLLFNFWTFGAVLYSSFY